MTNAWWTSGNHWLIGKSAQAYYAWLETKDGKRYKRSRKKNKSPYQFGFHLPMWIHEAIDALGNGDEETFKAIKLLHL